MCYSQKNAQQKCHDKEGPVQQACEKSIMAAQSSSTDDRVQDSMNLTHCKSGHLGCCPTERVFLLVFFFCLPISSISVLLCCCSSLSVCFGLLAFADSCGLQLWAGLWGVGAVPLGFGGHLQHKPLSSQRPVSNMLPRALQQLWTVQWDCDRMTSVVKAVEASMKTTGQHGLDTEMLTEGASKSADQ